MKSINKFYCRPAKIELLMTDLKDNEDCLYIVKETPRKKHQCWKETTYKYWHSDKANRKFIELVTFWCK